MEIERKQLKNWNAIIFINKDDNEYVIAHDGVGGAIIAHTNKEEAEHRWIDAMQLSDAVKKLELIYTT
jgi:hypothetical protein